MAEAALLGTLGILGAGAAAGALGSAAEYCTAAIGQGEWSWDEFGTTVAAGAGIGAVTAGIGGLIAGRATHQAAKEAEEQAAREAAERAAKEAAERSQGSRGTGSQGGETYERPPKSRSASTMQMNWLRPRKEGRGQVKMSVITKHTCPQRMAASLLNSTPHRGLMETGIPRPITRLTGTAGRVYKTFVTR